jgi:hypothetical protein
MDEKEVYESPEMKVEELSDQEALAIVAVSPTPQ